MKKSFLILSFFLVILVSCSNMKKESSTLSTTNNSTSYDENKYEITYEISNYNCSVLTNAKEALGNVPLLNEKIVEGLYLDKEYKQKFNLYSLKSIETLYVKTKNNFVFDNEVIDKFVDYLKIEKKLFQLDFVYNIDGFDIYIVTDLSINDVVNKDIKINDVIFNLNSNQKILVDNTYELYEWNSNYPLTNKQIEDFRYKFYEFYDDLDRREYVNISFEIENYSFKYKHEKNKPLYITNIPLISPYMINKMYIGDINHIYQFEPINKNSTIIINLKDNYQLNNGLIDALKNEFGNDFARFINLEFYYDKNNQIIFSIQSHLDNTSYGKSLTFENENIEALSYASKRDFYVYMNGIKKYEDITFSSEVINNVISKFMFLHNISSDVSINYIFPDYIIARKIYESEIYEKTPSFGDFELYLDSDYLVKYNNQVEDKMTVYVKRKELGSEEKELLTNLLLQYINETYHKSLESFELKIDNYYGEIDNKKIISIDISNYIATPGVTILGKVIEDIMIYNKPSSPFLVVVEDKIYNIYDAYDMNIITYDELYKFSQIYK